MNANVTSRSRRLTAAFSGRLPALFACFILLSVVLRIAFVVAHWKNLKGEGFAAIGRAVLLGMRFDVAVVACIFIPLVVLYGVASAFPAARWLRHLFVAGVFAAGLFVAGFWLADIQYFHDAGKHFTYEAFEFLNRDMVPIVQGAFELHPWFSSFSLMACVAVSLLAAALAAKSFPRPSDAAPSREMLVPMAVALVLLLTGARGGVIRSLEIGDSFISGSPYLNAVCLNPIYSAFRTVLARSERLERFDETAGVRTVRNLLGLAPTPPVPSYPLLRESAGTPQGNRKNVVLVFLESWTGKDVGALGGTLGATPFFDGLARKGLLFSNFFSSGIRSPEGIFSTLCSFPNQPLIPILARPEADKTYWRSLNRILEQAGYGTVFLHGSDLDFDDLRADLKMLGFEHFIDMHDFPKEAIDKSVWGVHDEMLMRRADAEFAEMQQPFFGVIYTVDTHPPFTLPPGFPPMVPPTDDSNRYVNALRYSDHSLEVLFQLARARDFYRNTLFLLVADHTRTRDSFNFANQHYIPFLIYSPGSDLTGVSAAVGSHVDILPTVLRLLELKTRHASWGQDLLEASAKTRFAVSIVGTDVKWRDDRYLLVDNRTDSGKSFLCDVNADSECSRNVWDRAQAEGERRKTQVRAYTSLSQLLLRDDRVYPRVDETAVLR